MDQNSETGLDLMPSVAISAGNFPVPDAALDRAGRINFFHMLSAEAGRVSIMAAIATGVELHRAKTECQHGMLLTWVKENCPFSDRTARRYMALSQAILGDRLTLAMGADAPRAMIEASAGELDARTLSDLYVDMGIVKRGAALGGKRDGAGRPKARDNMTADEIEEAARESARQTANDVANLLELFCTQEMWRALDRQNGRIFARLLKEKQAIVAAGIESI